MTNASKVIIADMREFHPSKWISPVTAVWRVRDGTGVGALQKLVNAGIIQQTHMNGLPFVRYIPKPQPQLKSVE